MKLMILTMLMLQSSNTTDILIVIKTGIVSGRFVFLSAILFICCGSVFQLLKFQLVALTPVLKAGRFYRYTYIHTYIHIYIYTCTYIYIYITNTESRRLYV